MYIIFKKLPILKTCMDFFRFVIYTIKRLLIYYWIFFFYGTFLKVIITSVIWRMLITLLLIRFKSKIMSLKFTINLVDQVYFNVTNFLKAPNLLIMSQHIQSLSSFIIGLIDFKFATNCDVTAGSNVIVRCICNRVCMYDCFWSLNVYFTLCLTFIHRDCLAFYKSATYRVYFQLIYLVLIEPIAKIESTDLYIRQRVVKYYGCVGTIDCQKCDVSFNVLCDIFRAICVCIF